MIVDNLIKWLDFPPLGDDRGSLVALEGNKTIPFEIKRVYYLFGTANDVTRGLHAHLALKQVLLCVTGSCKVLLDDGVVRESVFLDSPTKGLLVNSLVWREMSQFSSDCVLLVIASEHYDETDYIRCYERFKKVAISGK
ncbi:FdtA/QdtA family cupin domain-containing protein [Porticoccaceae bacterium]|nr:FdtA/QdtA family cupin domain-containing protein [Porticoccaceae bacterium]